MAATCIQQAVSEPSTVTVHSFCSLASSTHFRPSLRPTTSVSDELHYLNSRTTDAINVTNEMYRTRDRCRQNKTRMNYDRKNDTSTEHMGDKLTQAGHLTDITNTLTRLHNIV